MSGGLPVAENTFGPTGLVSRTGLTAGSSGLSGYSTMYYMFDAAGNVSERDDASGDIMSTGSFDAFGAGGMQTVPGTTGLSGDPFGFGGRFGYYTDSETRLVLCGQRYYDPGAARWLTRDPIGLFGGVNPYAYCGNNPVGAADPSGELYGVFSLGAVAQVLAPGMGADVSLLIGANGIALSSDVYTGMGKGVGWSAGGGIGFASGDVPIGAHYSSTAGIVGFADVGVGFSGGASRPITDSSKLDSVKDLLADVAGTGGFGRMGVGDGFGVMGTSGFSGSVGVSWAPVNSAINAVETEGNTLLTGIVAGIYNLDGLNGLTGLTGETDQSGPCPWG